MFLTNRRSRRGGRGWFLLLASFVLMLQIRMSLAFSFDSQIKRSSCTEIICQIPRAGLFGKKVVDDDVNDGRRWKIKNNASKLRMANFTTRRQTVSTGMKLTMSAGAHISFTSYLLYVVGWTWNAKLVFAFLPLWFLLLFFTGGELFAKHIANVACISFQSRNLVHGKQ